MRTLTGDLAHVQGLLKAVPEDFVVEELPAYLPSGEGEHLFLFVEKTGRTTQEVVRAVARSLGVDARAVGVAGQKDRQAVTRQWISVPAGELDAEAAALEGDGWRVLEAARHGNKLRTGHLSGNRFRIRLRGGGEGLEAARAIFARLAVTGVPAYFGPQRFGRGDGAAAGRALLSGERRPRGRFERRMAISALQAALFNEWLDRRIDDGLLDAAVAGDVLRVRASGGLFLCEDARADGPRVRAGEVDPTGPVFGHRMRRAAGEALAREDAVLEAEGLTLQTFAAGGRDARGTRRPARLPLTEMQVEGDGPDLVVAFALPPGGYATVVLAELTGSG